MKRKVLAAMCALALVCSGCGNSVPEGPPVEELLASGESVLSTAGSPLSPFTFLAMGRQLEDGRQGVCEIHIYDGDTLVQTLSVQEAIDADGVDGILPGYTEYPTDTAALRLVNMDFDEVPDIELVAWTPNNTIPHYYWLWDAEAEEYRYAFCLQGAEADTETEEIVSQYKFENGVYYTDHYRYGEDGQLELVQREVEDWTRGTQDAPLREVYDMIDGQLALQE